MILLHNFELTMKENNCSGSKAMGTADHLGIMGQPSSILALFQRMLHFKFTLLYITLFIIHI